MQKCASPANGGTPHDDTAGKAAAATSRACGAAYGKNALPDGKTFSVSQGAYISTPYVKSGPAFKHVDEFPQFAGNLDHSPHQAVGFAHGWMGSLNRYSKF